MGTYSNKYIGYVVNNTTTYVVRSRHFGIELTNTIRNTQHMHTVAILNPKYKSDY